MSRPLSPPQQSPLTAPLGPLTPPLPPPVICKQSPDSVLSPVAIPWVSATQGQRRWQPLCRPLSPRLRGGAGSWLQPRQPTHHPPRPATHTLIRGSPSSLSSWFSSYSVLVHLCLLAFLLPTACWSSVSSGSWWLHPQLERSHSCRARPDPPTCWSASGQDPLSHTRAWMVGSGRLCEPFVDAPTDTPPPPLGRPEGQSHGTGSAKLDIAPRPVSRSGDGFVGSSKGNQGGWGACVSVYK